MRCGKMKNYYLKGEEKFGIVTSFLYSLGTRSQRIRKFYDFVAQDIQKTSFNDLLDVGTGPGYLPKLLLGTGKLKRIYAIDPSKEMIGIAKAKSKANNIKFGLGSSRYIPFRRKFDLIISTLSFHHWAEKENSLIYLSKFLKKRGEIRIYEFEKKELSGIGRYFVSSHAVSIRDMQEAAKRSKLGLKSIVQKDGFIRISFEK
jgi:ubiquinone/menaquinone biosynthesis C-methylase UbiE